MFINEQEAFHEYKTHLGTLNSIRANVRQKEVALERLDQIRKAGYTFTDAAYQYAQANEEPFDVQVAKKVIQLYNSATARSKEFNLTVFDVRLLLSSEVCAYTGVTFVNEQNHPLQKTIDRLDPSKGYVTGNVFAVTKRINEIKNILLEQSASSYYTSFGEFKALINTLDRKGFNNV